MADLGSQLLDAANSDDAAGVQACLAAGVNVNVRGSHGWAPLHIASYYGHTECVAALLAGGADPNLRMADGLGEMPLHVAAPENHARCVQLLLEGGADPRATPASDRSTALHYAATNPACRKRVVRLLLQAEPAAALARDADYQTPLTAAIFSVCYGTARCLLEQGPLPPAREILAALASPYVLQAYGGRATPGAWRLPLYGALVNRQPLTAEEWGLVPTDCTGLGYALPAVLGRSKAEAAVLVRHLPLADRQRLRTAALCLLVALRRAGTDLPPSYWGRVLALSAA